MVSHLGRALPLSIYKLTLQYYGENFYGWQIQPEREKTIQGQLELALERILKDKTFKTMGAGRTDAGVHALGQVCRVETNAKIDPEGLRKGLNSHLPPEIRIKKLEHLVKDFHPTVDVISKEYFYLFSNAKEKTAFQNGRLANTSYELDIEMMKKACEKFVGKHDFKAFMCSGTPVKSTIREIYKCELTYHNDLSPLSSTFQPYYKFSVNGHGFLK